MKRSGNRCELVEPGGFIVTVVDLKSKLIFGVLGLLVSRVDEFVIDPTYLDFASIVRHTKSRAAAQP